MSRLSKIPVEQWDPELVAMTQGDTATVIEQGITRMLAHCPEMARVAYRLALAGDLVRTEVVDAAVFREFAREYKVGMFPKTLIDYGESFIGVEGEERVLRRILGKR